MRADRVLIVVALACVFALATGCAPAHAITFSPSVQTGATGDVPLGVAVGDFDRDGLPDVATADFDSDRVTVLRNTGSPLFSPWEPYATPAAGDGPAAIAVADFDRDGWPDLATADQEADTVTVLRNTGAGSFAFLDSAPVGNNTTSVAVGDFNRDGWPDLVTADFSATLTVLANVAGTSFETLATPATGVGPTTVAVADFDRDGRPDLAVTEALSESVAVLRNTGDGSSFALLDRVDAGGLPLGLAVGDFDRDGFPDLVSAFAAGLTVLRNAGGSAIEVDATVPLASGAESIPWAIAVADLDRDGLPDVLVADRLDHSVRVVRNLGGGAYALVAPQATGSTPSSLAVADFDRDGTSDVVTADAGAKRITVRSNITQFKRTNAFVPLAVAATGAVPLGVAVGDFDRDGRPDIATADSGPDRVTVLRNTGAGASFAVLATPSTGAGPQAVAVGDFDRDGRPDLATADAGANQVTVLRNTADGGSFVGLATPSAGLDPRSLAVADVDRDGQDDLVAADFVGARALVLRNAGGGASFTQLANPVVGAGPASVAVADLDLDGRPDVVTADSGADRMTVLRNTGADPAFAQIATPATGDEPTGVAIVHTAIDPLPDLVTADGGADRVTVLRNTGAGATFAALSIGSNGAAAHAVAAADLDRDGRQDLVTADRSLDRVTGLRFDAIGPMCCAFEPLARGVTGDDPVAVAVADFDRDGRQDVVTADRVTSRVTVLRAVHLAVARTPATLAFGSRDVDDGASAAMTATVSNTGDDALPLDAIAVTGAGATQFERLTGNAGDCTTAAPLAPGASCTLRVRFDPGSTGVKSATLTVASKAPDSPSLAVALTGTGIQTALERDPATLALGPRDVDDGPTAPLTATISNTGSEPVTLGAITLGGADAGDFERVGDAAGDCTTGLQLVAGAQCALRARFDPAATGNRSALLTVASNAPDVTVALTGAGTQTQLVADPPALAFGSREIDDGPSAPLTATLANAGTEAVTLGAIALAGAGAGEFERLTADPGDCASAAVLGAGASCALRIRFDPASTGDKAAAATIASNAGTLEIALAGTGTHVVAPGGAGPGAPILVPMAMCRGRVATIVAVPGQPVSGTPGPDVIAGSPAADTIRGGGGNDTICAGGGADAVHGDAGADTIDGAAGNDTIHGGAGNDAIRGDTGDDRLRGGGGRDLLLGGSGRDDLRGESGRDRLGGGAGNDRVDGGSGDDLLDEDRLGSAGRDRLRGGAGNDRIRATGADRDDIDCGTGTDSVTLDRRDRQRGCERVRRVPQRSSR